MGFVVEVMKGLKQMKRTPCTRETLVRTPSDTLHIGSRASEGTLVPEQHCRSVHACRCPPKPREGFSLQGSFKNRGR